MGTAKLGEALFWEFREFICKLKSIQNWYTYAWEQMV